MIREAAAWTLYLVGDLICRIFDDWTRIGLRGPLYGLYNGAMTLSVKLQGDGPGPWE